MNLKTISVAAVVLITSAFALAWQAGGGRDDVISRAPSATAARAATKPLPAPTGRTVLRVAGVSNGNDGARRLKLDFATLDRLARERVTVREPFIKRDLTFNAIRMSEFARLAGIRPGASIYMHALDDYHVVLPIDDISNDALIATRVGGKPIPLAEGGPIRLVFTGDGSVAANTDNWIWSIDSMRVRG